MEKIRLGIVGSGGMAKGRARAFSRLDECEVVALAARNLQTGPQLAQEHGFVLLTAWPELVSRNDVDAVVICTNNESHGPIALGALDAGKHVFLEYPLARHLEEGERLVERAKESECVLRVAHPEAFSPRHRVLKEALPSLGDLLAALFVRLTPGCGGRPEMLFNLNVSGPPALFFVYHIYPLVDLFGPASWAEGYTEYVGLSDDGRYDRFINTVTVGFAAGGCGQWTWAGGISIKEAEEYQRIVMTGGSLIRQGGAWSRSTPEDVEVLEVGEETSPSLEEVFLNEVREHGTCWREDMLKALDAIRISLAAEEAAQKGRRVDIPGK